MASTTQIFATAISYHFSDKICRDDENDILSLYDKSDFSIDENGIVSGTKAALTEADIIAANDAWAMKLLREERDKRLSECDWVVARASELDISVDSAWATYRQALRDLPSNSSPEFNELFELDNVTWPTKPS